MEWTVDSMERTVDSMDWIVDSMDWTVDSWIGLQSASAHLNPSSAIVCSTLTMLQTMMLLSCCRRPVFPSVAAPWELTEAVSDD